MIRSTDPPERLLTVAEAAEVLNTSQRFPRRLRSGASASYGSAPGMSAFPNPHCGNSSRPGSSSRSPQETGERSRDGQETFRQSPGTDVRKIPGAVSRAGRRRPASPGDVRQQDRRGGVADPQGSRDPQRRLDQPRRRRGLAHRVRPDLDRGTSGPATQDSRRVQLPTAQASDSCPRPDADCGH